MSFSTTISLDLGVDCVSSILGKGLNCLPMKLSPVKITEGKTMVDEMF